PFELQLLPVELAALPAVVVLHLEAVGEPAAVADDQGDLAGTDRLGFGDHGEFAERDVEATLPGVHLLRRGRLRGGRRGRAGRGGGGRRGRRGGGAGRAGAAPGQHERGGDGGDPQDPLHDGSS